MLTNIDAKLASHNYQLATVEGLTTFFKEKHANPKVYKKFQVRLAGARQKPTVVAENGLILKYGYILELLGGDQDLLHEFFDWFVDREDQKILLLQAYSTYLASQ